MLESIRIPQIRAFCESKQPKCASEVAQYCDLALEIHKREKAAIAANQGREPVGTKPGYGVREQAVSPFVGHQTRLPQNWVTASRHTLSKMPKAHKEADCQSAPKASKMKGRCVCIVANFILVFVDTNQNHVS